MGLAKKLNGLLVPVGWQLQRVPDRVPLGKTHASAGHLVELIGPSGVGKSHLYAQLPASLKAGWLSRRCVRNHVRHSEVPFDDVARPDNELMETLLRWKHENLWAEGISLGRKVKLTDFFTYEMAADAYARQHCLPSCGVLSDEGITHNFTQELLTWYDTRAKHDAGELEQLRFFLQERSIILLDAPEEFIMTNLRRRHVDQQGRVMNDRLAHRQEREIIEGTIALRALKRRWIDVAQALGVAVLTLDASQDAALNVRQVEGFLRARIEAGGNGSQPQRTRTQQAPAAGGEAGMPPQERSRVHLNG